MGDCARAGRLLTALHADLDIVNCVACHPHEPLLASSGIESSIKMWEPRPSGGLHHLQPCVHFALCEALRTASQPASLIFDRQQQLLLCAISGTLLALLQNDRFWAGFVDIKLLGMHT